MTYDEVIEEEPDVTRDEVKAELKKHDADWHDFMNEFGNHEYYNGAHVLAWLGY